MIQRIQTIFLLGATIVSILLFFMPTSVLIIPNDSSYAYLTYGIRQQNEASAFISYNWQSFILNVLTTLTAVLTIFLYKKRFLQIRLCIVNMIFFCGLSLLMWYQIRDIAGQLNAESISGVARVFPLIGLIFTWLATRGIAKDIKLMKSYDRLR